MFDKKLTYHQEYYRKNKSKYKKGGIYYKYHNKNIDNTLKFKVVHKKVIVEFD